MQYGEGASESEALPKKGYIPVLTHKHVDAIYSPFINSLLTCNKTCLKWCDKRNFKNGKCISAVDMATVNVYQLCSNQSTVITAKCS